MADDTTVHVGSISPDPTAEEVAAIAAAVELAWPKGVIAEAEPEESRWRFSGRWWSRPLPSRRDRP